MRGRSEMAAHAVALPGFACPSACPQALTDGSLKYYWNPETNITTYQRPSAAPAASSYDRVSCAQRSYPALPASNARLSANEVYCLFERLQGYGGGGYGGYDRGGQDFYGDSGGGVVPSLGMSIR